MKTRVLRLMVLFAECFFTLRWKSVLSVKDRIVVFDIDNTIGDTWPTLNRDYESESCRYLNIDVFPSVRKLLESYVAAGFHIVFLSARPFRSFYITKKWLKENDITCYTLILVPTAQCKLKYLSSISRETDYFDDLSWNHENGDVRFYTDVIDEVKRMRFVKHYDYEYLLRKRQEND
jgi:hypothetical protein